MNLRRISVTLLLVVCFAQLAQAQGFSVESSNAPSLKASDKFVSESGRFSIALPNRHGFRPVAFDTDAGKATGDAYTWSMKEGNFTVSYADFPRALDQPNQVKGVLDGGRDAMVAGAAKRGGSLVRDVDITLDSIPGREIRLQYADNLFVDRVYLSGKRLYQVMVTLKSGQAAEEAQAVKALDSFKILSPSEVDSIAKKKIADATPPPLPQEPVAARVASDAAMENLNGKVMTVLEESEDLSGTGQVGSRKPSSKQYYNEQGNLIRSERYDSKGNLSDLTVYGYLEGDRVSNSSHIEHEYNPPPMIVPAAPGQTKVTRDQRYSIKYKYRFDEKKRLIEELVVGNDGELRRRCTHEYKDNRDEELCYSDGKMYYRSVDILNSQGVVIERTISRPKRGAKGDSSDQFDSVRYAYDYQFDAKGNWTRQVTSKWVTKNDRSYYEPSSVNYRTISYH